MDGLVTGRTRNFLAMAQAAAGNSTYRFRLGAVVVSGGRVRGVGWSKSKNRPGSVSDVHLKRCSVHAEADALRGLDPLRRATCYVARIDARNEPVLARPCADCFAALSAAGVTRVFWTIDDEGTGSAKVEGASVG